MNCLITTAAAFACAHVFWPMLLSWPILSPKSLVKWCIKTRKPANDVSSLSLPNCHCVMSLFICMGCCELMNVIKNQFLNLKSCRIPTICVIYHYALTPLKYCHKYCLIMDKLSLYLLLQIQKVILLWNVGQINLLIIQEVSVCDVTHFWLGFPIIAVLVWHCVLPGDSLPVAQRKWFRMIVPIILCYSKLN